MQTVSAVLILDGHGKKLFGKYYDQGLSESQKQQAALERQLSERTRKQQSCTGAVRVAHPLYTL